MSISESKLPQEAFLNTYAVNNNYVDCLTTVVERNFSSAEFVRAFYTSWFFKIERWIIAIFVLKPSTDNQVDQLLRGERQTFSAWHLEKSSEDQWLMCDFLQKTRSWFMVKSVNTESGKQTRLYFGTGIVANAKDKKGNPALTLFFKLLLIYHKWYAVRLLAAAKSKLEGL